MTNFFQNFLKDEDGAVTVDWVVLTAAVVGLGIAGVAAVNDGVVGLADNIGSTLSDADVNGPTSLGFGGTTAGE